MAVVTANAIESDADVTTIRTHLKILADTILKDISEFSFLWVDKDRAQYLDADAQFGASVSAAFPSATGDISEAGNCLAAECTTAAVFHLMRAAEVALRALAADRPIKFTKGVLDAKQWGEIISQLTKYAGALGNDSAANWPSEPIRQAQIKFYQEAMVEFRAFNDAWRRHVSHAHEGAFYDRDQAASVYNHTRAFMQQLATKLSETTAQPLYWTAK